MSTTTSSPLRANVRRNRRNGGTHTARAHALRRGHLHPGLCRTGRAVLPDQDRKPLGPLPRPARLPGKRRRGVALPSERAEVEHAWHLYVIRLRLDRLSIDRGRFINELKERKIGASVHFIPIHLHQYYRDKYGYKPEDFPNAYREYQRIISLPLYPRMTNRDAQVVRLVASAGGVRLYFRHEIQGDVSQTIQPGRRAERRSHAVVGRRCR